jgi:hypothetical protein
MEEFYKLLILILAAMGAISAFNFNRVRKFKIFSAVQPSIRVSLKNKQGSVSRGSKIDVWAFVEGIGDYDKLVNLNTLRKPKDIRISFYSFGQKRIPPFDAIMTLEVPPEVPLGKYLLEVEAKGSDGKLDSCPYELTVY